MEGQPHGRHRVPRPATDIDNKRTDIQTDGYTPRINERDPLKLKIRDLEANDSILTPEQETNEIRERKKKSEKIEESHLKT